MIEGINCVPNNRNVSFEECIDCAYCLPKPMIKTLLPKEKKGRQPNSYNVSTICSCLRKGYFMHINENRYNETLESMYLSRRGEGFEWLLDNFSLKQIDGSISFKHDDELLYLFGRIDGYDSEEQELIELKSVAKLENLSFPKSKDRLQLQCYGTIFSSMFPIKKMKLVYASMMWPPKVFEIESLNMTKWMKNRIILLHESLRKRRPPLEEQSSYCKYCPYKSRCNLTLPIVYGVKRVKKRSDLPDNVNLTNKMERRY